ncbi:MAG: phage tail protein [Clostridiales bacterium]|jgi:hypothetical protein|nr:phage tail protein [Clostridiales bacterium]
MAISTSGIYLKVKGTASETYEDLVDIKAFPDMGAAPQTIETTTLSDTAQKFIMGVKTTVPMEFTANYDPADYDKLIALTGEQNFALYFGKNGENGIFTWSGELTVWVVGAGTNAAVDMKISIVPTGEINKEKE